MIFRFSEQRVHLDDAAMRQKVSRVEKRVVGLQDDVIGQQQALRNLSLERRQKR